MPIEYVPLAKMAAEIDSQEASQLRALLLGYRSNEVSKDSVESANDPGDVDSVMHVVDASNPAVSQSWRAATLGRDDIEGWKR